MKDLVYISIDCESTGICIENVDILELGAVIDVIPADPENHEWTPIEDLPKFQTYFLPPNGIFKGEPGGLAMNSKILQTIADKSKIIKDNPEMRDHFTHPQKLGAKFKRWMMESAYEFRVEKDSAFTLVAGKNFDKFDRQLLDAKTDLFKHVVLRGAAIDPGILFLTPGEHKKLPSLYECKEMADVEGIVTHFAVDDAIDVIECLRHYYSKGKYKK